MRARATLALVALAACGKSTSRVTVEVLTPARCQEFCVTEIEATIAGTTRKLDCGATIDLGEIEAGATEQLEVAARGMGVELTGSGSVVAREAEEVTVDLTLVPTTRPRVIQVTAPHPILYGPSEVHIIGEGFGSGGEVTMGGVPLEVLDWSPELVRATAASAGDVVVTRCGVRSASVSSGLSSPKIEVLNPLPAACAQGNLRGAGATFQPGSVDAPFGVFDCGVEGTCGPALIALLDPAAPTFAEHWETYDVCPGALTISDGPSPFLIAGGALHSCELRPGHALDCRRRTPSSVREASAVSDTRAAFIRAQTSTSPGQVWLETENAMLRIGEGVIEDAIAVDRTLVLDRGTTSRPRLHAWTRAAMQPIELTLPLTGCTTPKLLVSSGKGDAELARIVVVACDETAGARLMVFDLASKRTGPLRSITVRGVFPQALALSEDAAYAVAWVPPSLTFVDLVTGEILGARTLPMRAQPIVLARAPFSNTFFLKGPSPGEVTRIAMP